MSPASWLLNRLVFKKPFAWPQEEILQSRADLEDVGKVLIKYPTPWTNKSQQLDLERLWHGREDLKDWDSPAIKFGPDALFGCFVLLAALIEHTIPNEQQQELTSIMNNIIEPLEDRIGDILLARLKPKSHESIQQLMHQIGINEEQQAFVVAWIRHDVSLLSEPSSTKKDEKD